jgi:bifunctional non-homologous end joining protein LigD
MAATATVVDSASLYFREGTSDKVYHATLEDAGSGYVVNFSYGRRGSTLKTGSKTARPVSMAEARKVFDRLVAEKTGKGYQYMTSSSHGTPGGVAASNRHIPTVVQTAPAVSQCVLLNPINPMYIETYLQQDEWVAQPKLDGVRFMLRNESGGITAINRKGGSVAVPNEIIECIEAASSYYEEGLPDFFIDGELIGSTYYVFDILEHDGNKITGLNVVNRMEILRTLFDDLESDNLKLVNIVEGRENKTKLYVQLQRDKKEGVVFKYREATYTTGRPASGGNYMKHKFYDTASCIVSRGQALMTNGKRSVALKVQENGVDIAIGNVAIPANHPIPSMGDIVEIKYLYAYKNGSLYQPIYLGKRTDLTYTDCKYGQLKFKSDVGD